MFQLFRSEFSTSANALLENAPVPNHLLDNNPFQFDSGDSDVRVFHPGHGFIKNDRIFISGLDADSYAGIPTTAIIGTRTVTEVDHTGYRFGVASGNTATSSLRLGGDGIIVSKNAMYNSYLPTVGSITPENTTLGASVKLTEGASFGDIQGGRNEAANGAYVKDTSYNEITLNEINTTETAKIIAETHPTDGSSAAKHVTSQITLEEPAVGLKIIFAANRPTNSDFKVYYKTGTGDDVLDDTNWILVGKEADIAADDDGVTFRDYEYLAGGIGGALTPFTTFQVKVVFTSTNSSKVPTIQDLRVIALAT
jgi:hypothetical protein